MAVLGISCNWVARRVSYAILQRIGSRPHEIDVNDLNLSQDVDAPSEIFREVWNGVADLCKKYPIEKACLFAPSGLEKPMARPGWRPPGPMKSRMEGIAAFSIESSGIPVEFTHTKKIASDLGLGQKGNLRRIIRSAVDRILITNNDDQRYAVAAALTIL